MIIDKDLDREFRMAKTGSKGGSHFIPKSAGFNSGPNGNQPSGEARNLARVGIEKKGSGGVDVKFSTPEIRNPLLNLVNFYLPYDRKTLNQWIRYYDRFQPMIGNAIDMHGEFPISDFRLTEITDKEVLNFYEEQKERAGLVDFCFEASREFELIGEVHAFWSFNEDDGMWDEYVILNPDLLDIKELNWGSDRQMLYSYEPPQELHQLVNSESDRIQQALDKMDPVVLDAVLNNDRIPLDQFNVTSLIRRASPYDIRGTSIVLRCLKDLLYEDKLREVQYAIADQQITPIQLWKLGDAAAGYMPTEEDLQAFRALLMQGAHDPLFTIVSHAAVAVDLIGYTGKLLPVIPEFEWVENRVLTALYTNKAMTSGEGPTLQSGAIVALKVIQGRYQSKRNKLIRLLKKKIFEPLAEHHGIYDTTEAELSHRIRRSKKDRKLIVPEVEWEFKLDLTEETQRIQFLVQLRQNFDLPMKTICDVLDLDYDNIKKYFKEEEGTAMDPAYRDARKAKAAQSGMVPGGAGGGVGGVPGAAGGEVPPEAAPAEGGAAPAAPAGV